ncbi:MAG: HDOD domain-containing protein, partial [Gemmatimonadaceae bacterium]
MAPFTKDTRTQYRDVGDAGNTDARTRLDARLLAIQRGEDFPALSRAIVDTLTVMPDDGGSLRRLANVVMREYTLTLRVIRTANTVLYRRSNRPVQSATHAMLLLGADTVRKIAGSLLLFEHYHRKSSGLRELMLLSLLTANHAREIAIRVGGIDPEEAHLCGMFRNLGEVLVAAHFSTDYARIRDLVEGWGRSEAQAVAATLGCGYDTLGEEIGRFWGLPQSVLTGLRHESSASSSIGDAVVALSHELTTAVYRRTTAADPNHISRVVTQSAEKLGLSADALREILESALAETREVFASAGISLDDLRLRRQTDAALVALGVPTPTHAPVIVDVPAPRDYLSVREDLRKAVAASADPASGDDVHRLLMVTLEAAYRGCPLDRAIMTVMSVNRRELHGRLGFGAGIDTLLETFRFGLTPRDGPVALAA